VGPEDRLKMRKQDDTEGQIFNNPLLPLLPSPPSASSSPGESRSNKTGNHCIPTRMAKIKKTKKQKTDNTK